MIYSKEPVHEDLDTRAFKFFKAMGFNSDKKLKVERYIDKHIYWYLNLSGEQFGMHRYGLSNVGLPKTYI